MEVKFTLLIVDLFLLCLISAKGSLATTSSDCRVMMFEPMKNGSILIGHVIRNYSARDSFKCYLSCFDDLACVSYNFGLRSSAGLHECQLNNVDRFQFPKHFHNSSTHAYHGLNKNGCRTSPCWANATCQAGFGEQGEGFHCLCPAGTHKNKCERAMRADEHRVDNVIFQVFTERKTWEDARETCISQGALLAPVVDERMYDFITKTILGTLPTESLPLHLHDPLKHFRLDGSDLDVSLHGSASFASESGTTVLSLPGTVGSYATTSSIDVNITSLTIALWVKLFTRSANFFFSDFVGATPSFAVGVLGRMELLFGLKNTVNKRLAWLPQSGTSTRAISIDIWTHVAVTFDHKTGQSEIFKDGVKVTNMTTSVTPRDIQINHNSSYNLGCWDNKHWLQGQVSQVLMYGRALSTEDINIVKDATSVENANRVWVGISDLITEGRYQSTHPGSPDATYLKWSSNQPLNQNDEDCLAVKKWEGGGMEEEKCGEKLPFVCRRKV